MTEQDLKKANELYKRTTQLSSVFEFICKEPCGGLLPSIYDRLPNDVADLIKENIKLELQHQLADAQKAFDRI